MSSNSLPDKSKFSGIDSTSSSEKTAPFFAVSVFKLAVMSICTLGFYQLYWFYKNWQLIQLRENTNISPFWRAFFGLFFCHSCFSHIREYGKTVSVTPLSTGSLATGFVIITLAGWFPAPYFLIGFLSVAFLLPIQAFVNQINGKVTPNHQVGFRLRGWNWVAVVAGGLFFILVVIGAFLPPPMHKV